MVRLRLLVIVKLLLLSFLLRFKRLGHVLAFVELNRLHRVVAWLA
jgi:hypothetical protein